MMMPVAHVGEKMQCKCTARVVPRQLPGGMHRAGGATLHGWTWLWAALALDWFGFEPAWSWMALPWKGSCLGKVVLGRVVPWKGRKSSAWWCVYSRRAMFYDACAVWCVRWKIQVSTLQNCSTFRHRIEGCAICSAKSRRWVPTDEASRQTQRRDLSRPTTSRDRRPQGFKGLTTARGLVWGGWSRQMRKAL